MNTKPQGTDKHSLIVSSLQFSKVFCLTTKISFVVTAKAMAPILVLPLKEAACCRLLTFLCSVGGDRMVLMQRLHFPKLDALSLPADGVFLQPCLLKINSNEIIKLFICCVNIVNLNSCRWMRDNSGNILIRVDDWEVRV
jgi:hypothetical protein